MIAAAMTDRGIVKQSNQDCMCFLQAETSRGPIALAMICDGMGGLQKGEVASATLTRMFARWFETELPMQIEAFDWRGVIDQWNRMILNAAQQLSAYGARNGVRLGTTVTAMLFFEYHYLIAHVGDSRVYEISDTIRQMTEAQTLVAREVRQGLITAEQAEHDPRRNVLLQCVGASASMKPDILIGENMKYTIQSKIYVPISKRETLLKIAIYLSVAVVALSGFFSVLSSGAKIGNISPIIIAAAVGISVNRRFRLQSRYEFCVAETTLYDNMLTIDYIGCDLSYQFRLNEIKELQYSDQLQCLRFFGNFTKTSRGITSVHRDEEHLFYVNEEENKAFLDQLIENTNRCITFMDRASESKE